MTSKFEFSEIMTVDDVNKLMDKDQKYLNELGERLEDVKKRMRSVVNQREKERVLDEAIYLLKEADIFEERIKMLKEMMKVLEQSYK